MNLRETAALSIVGLTSHKLRTLLTMLGIIFGVAAVIAMLQVFTMRLMMAFHKS